MKQALAIAAAFALMAAPCWSQQQLATRLTTRWSQRALVGDMPAEYPRPQFVRTRWHSLNGKWDYAVRAKSKNLPETRAYDGKINVPFPVESYLSGVQRFVGGDQDLWYRTSFTVPDDWNNDRIVLHFGAVDWQASVWVNGQLVGEHTGGYDPFSFDITDALTDRGHQQLVVRAWDPTDGHWQPRGKQVRSPHGIWYTPTTGIWQTVWLEPVPNRAIADIRIDSDIDSGKVTLAVSTSSTNGTEQVRAIVTDGGKFVAMKSAAVTDIPLKIRLPRPALWSPASPQLYDVRVELLDGDTVIDTVNTYFALRKISVGEDERGVVRLLLNNEPLFQFGLLDQGFWPDGLYTAPSDEALCYDLAVTKRLGFNMVRKHVKVEPARWYYHCDRLGLLVWQDMPSGDRYIGANDPDIERSPESAGQFRQEWSNIISHLKHFPCIVMWVPFNEGWGQFDTAGIVELTRQRDPTRLVNATSGWTDRGVGDVHDIHVYPGPGMPPVSARAAVLGEFGGLGLPIEGHTWQSRDNWGYRSFENRDELNAAFLQLIDRLHPLIGQGLSAAIYTQTTDVEIEVNGVMTYDRGIVKLDELAVAAAHRRLFGPPPRIDAVVPTSREQPQPWRYTTRQPGTDWTTTSFDDSAWNVGPGGFGKSSTPGSVVRTEWTTPDIWLRRKIDIPAGDTSGLQLTIHHDEDAEVYLDGELLARTTGYTTDYFILTLTDQARSRLTSGPHTLAVHCHQTGGGQYIDVGVVRVTNSP